MSDQRFSRSEREREGYDCDKWRAVDLTVLPDGLRGPTENRIKAIRAFLKEGASLEEIQENTGYPAQRFIESSTSAKRWTNPEVPLAGWPQYLISAAVKENIIGQRSPVHPQRKDIPAFLRTSLSNIQMWMIG